MKMRKLSAAALALSMLSATTSMVASAADFTVDEDGNYIANGLMFTELEDGTLSVVGLVDETLTEVVIPEEVDGKKVTEIDSNVFEACTSIESVIIPDSVTSIGKAVFSYCTSLKSITIPAGVTYIDYWTFQGCKSLKSIIILGDVTSIGFAAFSECISLESITIPISVTYINTGAFSGCTSLTSIEIPDGVTYIDAEAFYGCTSLESVTIPNSVTEIGLSAFSECTNLTDVYYEGTGEQWKEIQTYIIEKNEEYTGGRKISIGDEIALEWVGFGNSTIHFNYVPETTDDSNDNNSSDVEDSESSSDSNSATETETFTSGDVTATADEGAVPEGAEFSAELKSDENGEYSYELMFIDKDGKEVQPEGSVTVKLPLPEALKGKTVYVYRVEGEKYTDMKAKVDGDYVVFTTDHFSEYLITAEEKGETTPDTGFGGVAMTLGVVALAGAAVVVSRKRK